jgi:uncharacterized protein (TIGR03435 family)
MIRNLAVLLLPALALGQTEKTPLRFDVCDIQVSKIVDPQQMKADFLPGGRVDVRGLPLKTIVAFVSRVPEDLVVGPAWMSADRYDIVCKAPPASTNEQLIEMGRTMLAERFKMVAHADKKVVPVYALTVGKKGAQMTPVKDTRAESPGDLHDVTCVQVPALQTETPGTVHRDCRAVTMADFAHVLPQIAPAYMNGLEVVDLTGLKGAFDFKLDWMGRNFYNAALAAGASGGTTGEAPVSIFDAVERLGLHLENRKYPMDALVIDSIERKPTEN